MSHASLMKMLLLAANMQPSRLSKPAVEKADAGTKAAAKRKPRGKKIVSSSESEASESESDAISEEDDDVYELDAPSPAIAPKVCTATGFSLVRSHSPECVG